MQFLLKTIRFILWSTFTCVCVGVLICASVYLYLAPTLPATAQLKDVQLQTPLRIYSSDGKLISEYGEKRRKPLVYEQIPPLFVKALISTEDKNFETHHGIDPKGFIRAVVETISTGRMGGGGSTLTQQVAKNFFLSRKKTLDRKFGEIILAFHIEQELTKQEIMELYVNKSFLGHRSYGIQAAAQVYYGKDINDLSLAEIAMIAGLHQRPGKANPISYPQNALPRRNTVLNRMYKEGFISKASLDIALKAPITAKRHGGRPEVSSHYIGEMVRDEMFARYGEEKTYTQGFQVYTTIQSDLQEAANRGVRNTLIEYSLRHGYHGPEKQWPIEPGKTSEQILAGWLAKLKIEPAFGGLQPAVVAKIEDQSIKVLTKQNKILDINWQGLSWARRYLDENSRGPAPKLASEFLTPGDMIRIQPTSDGNWRMVQIPKAQSAFVALDPDNGDIVALVGGFDFTLNQYNRVTQSKRQPGSNFKPFVYAAALDKPATKLMPGGYTASSLINDAPITKSDGILEGVWRPKNSGERYLGPIPLRQALYGSRNVSSIRLLADIGIDYTINYVERFGFEKDQLARDLTLTLGSSTASPLTVATAYAVFANQGYQVTPSFIQRIEDNAGNVVYRNEPATVCRDCAETPKPYALYQKATQPGEPQTTGAQIADVKVDGEQPATAKPKYAPQVLSPQTTYIMQSILNDVVTRGTATAVRRDSLLGRRNDLAGKTGTTNDAKDAWFTGFNGDYVASVWVGFDNSKSLGNAEFGGKAALPAWMTFMRTALDGKPNNKMSQPNNIVSVTVDPNTGLLARRGQSNTVKEIFRTERTPTERSAQSAQVEIDLSIDQLEDQADGKNNEAETLSPEMLF